MTKMINKKLVYRSIIAAILIDKNTFWHLYVANERKLYLSSQLSSIQ